MSDVSIVLNIHRELTYVRRTIQSLSNAAAYAAGVGLRTELILVFDRSDKATINAVKAAPFDAFSATQFIEVDHGSLGLSRNSGIAVANGEYLWLADADDLVSDNSITSMHPIARDVPRSVVFPEYLVAFGADCWVARYYDDSVVATADFAYGHPYISRIFTRKSNLDGLAFHDVQLSDGFAYVDWHFNCELRARGMRFCVAPQTLLFYRQRQGSLLRKGNAMSIGQIPHSHLFDPKIFSERIAQEEADPSRSEREERRESARTANHRSELMNDQFCRAIVMEATKIDPGINFRLIQATNNDWSNVFPEQHWGHQYAQICALVVGRKFSDIMLLPDLGRGESQKYVIDILNVLADADPEYRGIVVAGEAADHRDWADRLPLGTVFIDLYNSFPWLDEDARDLILLRLVTAMGNGARLHLKASSFVHRWFGRFAKAIAKQTFPVYYRSIDERMMIDGNFVELGWGFDFLSTEIENIQRVVSDHMRIIEQDHERIGVLQEKWHCLYASHEVMNDARREAAAFRIIWASRISKDKSPMLLPRIVRAVREVIPNVNFIAAGGCDQDSEIWMEQFRTTPGLEYFGPYDEFDALEPCGFDALLYTSAFDGLPNVVLEAMGHGLPVIAPDVGGIREAVHPGRTGWLIASQSDEDMLVQAYADAVLDLYRNWSRTRQMGEAARDLVRAQHSADRHRQQARAIFLHDGGRSSRRTNR